MSDALPIHIDPERLAKVCVSHGVARLSLYGSVIRDDFGPGSDVDILVEFRPLERIGLVELARLQIELSELIGRDVHLSTPRSLSRYFRQEVLERAVPVYVAA